MKFREGSIKKFWHNPAGLAFYSRSYFLVIKIDNYGLVIVRVVKLAAYADA